MSIKSQLTWQSTTQLRNKSTPLPLLVLIAFLRSEPAFPMLSLTIYHPLALHEPVALAKATDFQLRWLNAVVSFYFSVTNKFIIASPPPGQYNLPSDFGNSASNAMKKAHLYSFGAPHSVYKKVYNPDCPQMLN